MDLAAEKNLLLPVLCSRSDSRQKTVEDFHYFRAEVLGSSEGFAASCLCRFLSHSCGALAETTPAVEARIYLLTTHSWRRKPDSIIKNTLHNACDGCTSSAHHWNLSAPRRCRPGESRLRHRIYCATRRHQRMPAIALSIMANAYEVLSAHLGWCQRYSTDFVAIHQPSVRVSLRSSQFPALSPYIYLFLRAHEHSYSDMEDAILALPRFLAVTLFLLCSPSIRRHFSSPFPKLRCLKLWGLCGYERRSGNRILSKVYRKC